jgi:hypothetical protein
MDKNGKHTLWFTCFFTPKRFTFLIVGGILETGSSLFFGIVRNERFAILNLLLLIVFLIAASYLYIEAKSLLSKIENIFSVEESPLRDLFLEEDKFDNFVKPIRERIFSKNEYLLVFGTALFLGPLGFFQFFSRQTGLIDSIKLAYGVAYWTLALTICLSVVWAIFGIAISLNRLGKEKGNLEVSKSIEEFKNIVHSYKGKCARTPDFGVMEFSFGRLKEAISPLADFLYMLAVKIAVFGFLISIPPILEYSLTGNIYNLTYASSCAFTGFLSVLVFVFAQDGIFKIWSNSKDEALLAYEQLCEHVKNVGVGSIVGSRNHRQREKSEKDAVFIRSTMEDLRKLEATKFNATSVAKVAITIFLPLLTVVISRLIK